jgi:hypothetical protein
MNIIQIQDRLKGMPKEAIIKYVQNPTGDVPTFLALSELQRRKDSEEKYASMQESPATVAEQVVSENMPMGIGNMVAQNQPVPNTGIAAPQPNSMEAMGSGIAQLPVPEQNFANGGIVSFQEGGLSLDPIGVTDKDPSYPSYPFKYDYENYYVQPSAALVEVPEALSLEERLRKQREAYETQGVDPDFYKKQADELIAEKEKLKADKSEAGNLALIKAGLGIMGGTSQFALENIGKGAMPAIESYGQDVKDIKAQERLMKQAEMKLGEAEQAMKRGDVNAAMKAMDEREKTIQDAKVKNAELETSVLIADAKARATAQGKSQELIDKAVDNAKGQMESLYKQGVIDFTPTEEEAAKGITSEIKAEQKYQEFLRQQLAILNLDPKIADRMSMPDNDPLGLR